MNDYIFTSLRLGFRNWSIDDIDIMHQHINSDAEVMEFFPFIPSREQTKEFIIRMQQQFETKGFCYFAVDIIDTKEFIGFIGLCEQTYLDKPATFVDIGWRLKKSSWNKGYATEGAFACLAYGFKQLGLGKIYSVAPETNQNSIHIMKKIGMKLVRKIQHPKLTNYPHLESCVLYVIDTTNWLENKLQ